MKALEGLKVLDFSTLLPGPYASMVLADFGAEVLRVSAPGKRDLVEMMSPYVDDVGSCQMWLDRNKKSITVDLKDPKGVEIIKKLVEEYDVILEQFRPGVMKKLGLDYETLSQINPRLIYCSLTGYGQTGALSHKAGHDINYLSKSGLYSHSGRIDKRIDLMNFQIADIASGSQNAIIGILIALQYRNMTGEGQYIDISMYDGLLPFNSLSAASYLAGGEIPKREQELLNGGSLYDFYQTKDARFISVGSLEPKFWKEFCEIIGKEEWISDGAAPRDYLDRKRELEELILSKTYKEWIELFKDSDCCVEGVQDLSEVLEDEHTISRELIVEVETLYKKKVKQFANPIKMSKTKPEYKHCGYENGHDNEEIFKKFGF